MAGLGADSALLAWLCHPALGAGRAVLGGEGAHRFWPRRAGNQAGAGPVRCRDRQRCGKQGVSLYPHPGRYQLRRDGQSGYRATMWHRAPALAELCYCLSGRF